MDMQNFELGSAWKHKKKGTEYRLMDIKGDLVYLKALNKGSRSTWKYAGLLPYDYEKIPAA